MVSFDSVEGVHMGRRRPKPPMDIHATFTPAFTGITESTT
jgi:hypothetical protein